MTQPKLERIAVPESLAAMLQREGGSREIEVYAMGHCRVIKAREPVGEYDTDQRWHISISHPWRHPTWDELGVAKDALLPDLFMCVPHPPRAYWLNIHEHCFHLWEIRDDNLKAQWKYEGEVAAASGLGEPT